MDNRKKELKQKLRQELVVFLNEEISYDEEVQTLISLLAESGLGWYSPITAEIGNTIKCIDYKFIPVDEPETEA